MFAVSLFHVNYSPEIGQKRMIQPRLISMVLNSSRSHRNEANVQKCAAAAAAAGDVAVIGIITQWGNVEEPLLFTRMTE